MIYCPKCKSEIEDNSHYCDQCGAALLYCNNCGRVGIGRRCTSCGGMMVDIEELQRQSSSVTQATTHGNFAPQPQQVNFEVSQRVPQMQQLPHQDGIPILTLYNPTLNIRLVGVNGAIIGRRQGPYQQMFSSCMYVSSVHAQLIYRPDSGWAIIDKHSSNGSKVNQRDLQPDIPTPIQSGDIVTLADVNLQVSINE